MQEKKHVKIIGKIQSQTPNELTKRFGPREIYSAYVETCKNVSTIFNANGITKRDAISQCQPAKESFERSELRRAPPGCDVAEVKGKEIRELCRTK